MRRLTPFLALCMLSGCATFGGDGGEVGRKYVVFFTKDSAAIDGPGGVVVSHVAAVAALHADRHVVVAGYAAAHGNLDADQALSAARADAVSAALQADGVAATRITEHARAPANENPAVASRRVEIGFTAP